MCTYSASQEYVVRMREKEIRRRFCREKKGGESIKRIETIVFGTPVAVIGGAVACDISLHS